MEKEKEYWQTASNYSPGVYGKRRFSIWKYIKNHLFWKIKYNMKKILKKLVDKYYWTLNSIKEWVFKRECIRHRRLYKEAKEKYHGVYTGHKDKFGKELCGDDKIKITDEEGEHIMFVKMSPALYPRQTDEWVIEAIPSESGPGYWYYMRNIPERLKNEQIEKLNT